MNYFIALNNFKEEKGAPVYINYVFTEKINEKKPIQPIYDSDWLFYNPLKDGVPPKLDMQLPKELFMICKSVKFLDFDFFSNERREWIISEAFRNLILDYKLMEGKYEESSLTVLSDRLKPISGKKYFLIRIFKDDNEIVDFENSTMEQPGAGVGRPNVYYSNLKFKTTPSALFYLSDPFYKTSFFANKEIKKKIIDMNFKGFSFYTIQEYFEEIKFRDNHPNG